MSAGLSFSSASATTSGRDATLAQRVVDATDLPVSADLENGLCDDPRPDAGAIRLAAEAGLVGGSIEDSIDRPGEKVYELAFAVDRVRAAVEAKERTALPVHADRTRGKLSRRNPGPEGH